MPSASKELIENPQVCRICNCLLEHVYFFDSNLNTFAKGYYSIFIKNVNHFVCKEHYEEWNTEMMKLYENFLKNHGVEKE